jgi:ribosomal protein S18 acetylase RimI-like enzyme
MIIRKATSKDTEKILDLWQELMDFHKDMCKNDFGLVKNAKSIMKKHLVENLRKKTSIILVAEDKILVSFCFARTDKWPPVYKNRRYCYIDTAYTKKAYRNKGLMKKMILKIKTYYKGRGISDVILDVYHSNEIGTKSWKNIGFNALTNRLIKKIL